VKVGRLVAAAAAVVGLTGALTGTATAATSTRRDLLPTRLLIGWI
jgi:hypothetical protein